VIGFEARPRIWDIAAPWLLVTEAGGFIETYDGSHPFPVQSGIQYAEKDFATLAAASSELLVRARHQIVLKTNN
jgi:fructose-1,6-bisphosphatase/inositol monophosphatase family enzyme